MAGLLRITWVTLALALPLAGCQEQDKEAQRRETLARDQRRLEAKVMPVIEEYLGHLKSGDVEAVYSMLSSTLQKERTLEDMKKHWAREGEEYARVAATTKIQWVKPQGIYAVSQLRSVKGEEHMSLVEEGGVWKVHMASESFLKLISLLK